MHFAAGYWRGRTRRHAAVLAITAVLLVVLNLLVNLGLNQWNRWFFDMLEKRESNRLVEAMAAMLVLIVGGAGFAVAMVKCQMTLQLGWRRWMTHRLLGLWRRQIDDGLPAVPEESEGSPQYRLAEEVRLAIEPIVELSIGFLNALVLAVMFIAILVVVGGTARLNVAGVEIAIPAYLALTAIAYAAAVSSGILRIGRPLVRRLQEKNESEALFLFELTRAIDARHDTVRPQQGPATKHDFGSVRKAFHRAVRSWRRVIVEYGRVTWPMNMNAHFSPILPLILAAPKYVTGEYSLGAVIQLATAFVAVLGALNWLTDNYVRLAEWSASARRVDELRSALKGRLDTASR